MTPRILDAGVQVKPHTAEAEVQVGQPRFPGQVTTLGNAVQKAAHRGFRQREKRRQMQG
jgi:hypothetical protein